MKRNPMNGLTVLLVAAVVLCRNKAYAAENVTVPTEDKEIVSVVLPVVEERDPFSFFIDPLHIFYNTFGNSDEDVAVEEDTCLLFHNRDEGDYTFSSKSDRLEIINKSTVPVEVTITAKLESADGIFVMQEEAFADRDSCDLYLALVDNEGNEQPLSEDGEVFITVDLDRAPLDAYTYVFHEDTGKYEYVCQAEDMVFDVYSFGLAGACNERGDWAEISGTPHVTISWNVEPVISDDLDGAEAPVDENEVPVDGAEESVSGNEVPVDGAEAPEDENEEPVNGDEGPTGNGVADTKNQGLEGDGSDDGKTSEGGGSDSDNSGDAKKEETGNDSSASEPPMAEDIRGGSGVPEERQTQEINKLDETTKDNSAAEEEASGNNSSTEELPAAEESKDESAAPEENHAQG